MKILKYILTFCIVSIQLSSQELQYEELKKLISSTKGNADSLYFLNKQLLGQLMRMDNNKDELVNCYLSLSEAALQLGNVPEAAAYASEASILCEKERELANKLPRCYSQKAKVLNRQKKYKDALVYLRKADVLAGKQGNKKERINILGQMGFNFANLKIPDSALYYQNKSLAICRELKDSMAIATCYSNIGFVYYIKGQPQITKEYFYKAYNIRINSDSRYMKAASIIDCASVEQELGDSKKAISMMNRALSIIKSEKMFTLEANCYQSIAYAYENMNRFDSAYKYHKLYKAVSDSLFNEDNTKALTRVETKYQLNSKQNEIALLTEKNKNSELLVMREKMIRWIFVGGITLLILILFMVFRQLKIKKEAFLKINEQKEIIEEKNKEIVDSIHYARRIQSALMTSERSMETWLKRLKEE